MKTCTQCHILKESSEFYKKAAATDGLMCECKSCNLIRVKNYTIENKESRDAYHKEYNIKNRETILEKQKIAGKIYRQENKEACNKLAKNSQKRRKEWFLELRKNYNCAHCGFSDYRALQFHHINPDQKLMGITKMLYNGWPKEEILKEIEKCLCLCANCHFIEHFEQRNTAAN